MLLPRFPDHQSLLELQNAYPSDLISAFQGLPAGFVESVNHRSTFRFHQSHRSSSWFHYPYHSGGYDRVPEQLSNGGGHGQSEASSNAQHYSRHIQVIGKRDVAPLVKVN